MNHRRRGSRRPPSPLRTRMYQGRNDGAVSNPDFGRGRTAEDGGEAFVRFARRPVTRRGFRRARAVVAAGQGKEPAPARSGTAPRPKRAPARAAVAGPTGEAGLPGGFLHGRGGLELGLNAGSRIFGCGEPVTCGRTSVWCPGSRRRVRCGATPSQDSPGGWPGARPTSGRSCRVPSSAGRGRCRIVGNLPSHHRQARPLLTLGLVGAASWPRGGPGAASGCCRAPT